MGLRRLPHADAAALVLGLAAGATTVLAPAAAPALWAGCIVLASAGTLGPFAALAALILPLPLEVRITLAVAGVASLLVARVGTRRMRELEKRAFTDALTGLATFGFFERAAEAALARAERTGRPVSIVVFDLDRFKAFNDQHGHVAGNDLLAAAGAIVRRQARRGDLTARFGGEELVVLVDGTAEDATHLAERVRLRVGELAVPVRGGRAGVTVSAGVAQARPEDGLDDLLVAADDALYAAKNEGRDRVVVARTRRAGAIAA